MKAQDKTYSVYMVKLERKYHHVQYYIGYTSLPVEERLATHAAGHGSRLLAAAIKRHGIEVAEVRVLSTWPTSSEARAEERRLKKQKNGPRIWKKNLQTS